MASSISSDVRKENTIWYVEWNPSGETWNWHLKSVHGSLEEAKAARDKYIRDTIHDSNPSHWRVISD